MAHQWARRVTDHNSAALHNQNQHHDNQQEQEQKSPAQKLAERVHSWSTTELDYRPDKGDIRARSHPRIILHASTSRDEQPEYSPQALASLCQGPCGPMFEYLAENLKTRSKAKQDKDNAEQTLARKQQSLTMRQKQQSRTLQCHELTLSIARKQREIAECKERIKKQRQLQTVKEIHHQQEMQTIRVFQEYQARLQLTQIAVLQKTVQEISDLLKQVAVEQSHATRGSLEGRNGSIQSLYEHLQQTSDGVSHLLEIIAGSKKAQFLALGSLKDQRSIESGSGSETATSSEAASLLHMFRGHHIERVVQVESVLNKVSACEREKSLLYTEMRFRAQRRDQEKKPNHFLQELEETKAFLQGLRTALEFIQTEQENLVERLMAEDELRAKIEGVGRASRAADQKLRQAQHNVRKVTEMVQLNLEKVPSLANSIAGDITESLSQGLAQLSTSVQARNTTGVNDIKILQDLTQQSQTIYEANHAHLIPLPGPSWTGPSLLSSGSEMETAGLSWYETSGSASLSADQLIFQKARLQSHNMIRQLTVSKAKDLNARHARSNNETIESMKSTTSQILSSLPSTIASTSETTSQEDEEGGGALGVDSLDSKFMTEIKEIVGSLTRHDDEYHTALANEIEHILVETESTGAVAEEVRSLVDDGHRIASRFETTQGHGQEPSKQSRTTTSAGSAESKRMRFI
ncbi:hypothetical protein EC957_008841 [Mortierella hygrophila]|uniref:Uncharacterized protein n=1 Tax=Mortierella hygrophila TaxID=979708 RepID=A0A9P6K5F7_9FUNG|nr:hypothetical protein EC957_008841 [Mortierella hygrophila]